MKNLFFTLLAVFFAVTSFGQVAAITGTSLVCIGATTTLADATPGGTWTSSMPSVATIGSTTGVVIAVSAGVTTITYTVGASYATLTVTATSSPAPIAGPTQVCVGDALTLTDAVPGGVWTATPTTILVWTGPGGTYTGVAAGVATVTYSLGVGCNVVRPITVNPLPSAISGPSSVCLGSTITMSSATSGGIWSSFTPGIAYVGSSSGVVNGVVPGVATIQYTTPVGCNTTTTVSVTSGGPAIFTVTGGGAYCAGGAGLVVILTVSAVGVSYQLYNGSIPVGSALMGIGMALNFGLQTTAGTYTVTASSGGGCTATMSGSATIAINPLPVAYTVIGGGAYCSGGVGVHINLASSDAGVNYQLFNGSSMVGIPIAGTGSGIDFGLMTSAGTYTVVATNPTTGCSNNMVGSAAVSISPLPATYTVTGGGSYCAGGAGVMVGLMATATGISYQLMVGGIPVGSAVYGTGGPVSFGLQTMAGTYTVIATDAVTSCTTAMTGSVVVTITPLVVTSSTVTATPGSTICAGASDTFSVATTGGGSSPTYQWYLNSTLVTGATNSTFITMPLSGDVVRANVTSSASCASPAVSSDSVTVTVSTPTATATATTAACGGLVTLTGSGGLSYSWSPSTGLACASCAVTTVLPYASIVYSLTTTNTYGCTATATVAVDGNRISGHIGYAGGVSTDTFKVWLIQFNPADSSIIALDSTTSCDDGGVPYYEFMDPALGDYMVKAKLNNSVPGTSGYIPTYSLSSPFWYSGATVSHVSSADSMHIDMVYGTVPAGPGFIAGYVVSGAGKGTAGDAPAEGINIILKKSAGTLITITTTKSDGTYAFSNLAYGTYQLFPENYGDHTTPSAVITLSPGGDSVQNINFKQHTTSHTITPYENNKVKPVVNSNNGISIYPNPASDALFVSCDKNIWGTTLITLTDMTGRKVLETTIAKANISGSKVDLTGINKGMYIINAKSEGNTYTGKLTIR